MCQHNDTYHMQSIVMLSVKYVECLIKAHYAECHYAVCRYAECRYAECRYDYESTLGV
jgi:hypothetical protein